MSRDSKINKVLTKRLKECLSLFIKRNSITDDKKQQYPAAFLQGDFLRLEFEVEDDIFPQNLIEWLARQDEQSKFYWSERDYSYETAGLGYADLISDNPQITETGKSNSSSEVNSPVQPGNTRFSPADGEIINKYSLMFDYQPLFGLLNRRLGIVDNEIAASIQDITANKSRSKKQVSCSPSASVRYFGAIAFNTDDAIEEEWKNFGNFYFFVPRVEFINAGGKKIFAANIYTGDIKKSYPEIIRLVENLNFSDSSAGMEESISIFNLKILNRTDNPDRENWIKNLNKAIKIFDERKLEKIVLARKTFFKSCSEINPFSLLQALKKVNIRTFNFCFQPTPQTAFLGCSPELLFSRKNGRLYSEAVAGTVTSGSNPREDKLLASRLLKSEKDSEEYQFVYDSIKKDLNSIGTDFKVEAEKEVLKLSYAQHIISRFHCDIKPGIDDSRIIKALHPTPAVGGFPKKAVKKYIKKYEDFSRGFYAGPVGWIAKDSSEFVVGIRTGLVNKNTLSLYSGAGIVSKSVPEMEWEEIENKINPFLKLMDPQRKE